MTDQVIGNFPALELNQQGIDQKRDIGGTANEKGMSSFKIDKEDGDAGPPRFQTIDQTGEPMGQGIGGKGEQIGRMDALAKEPPQLESQHAAREIGLGGEQRLDPGEKVIKLGTGWRIGIRIGENRHDALLASGMKTRLSRIAPDGKSDQRS
jgi:hypothetical protein